jgi:hypothetical protein
MIFANSEFQVDKKPKTEKEFQICWPPKEVFETEKENFISQNLPKESDSIMLSQDNIDQETAVKIARKTLSAKFVLYLTSKLCPERIDTPIKIRMKPSDNPLPVRLNFDPYTEHAAIFTLNIIHQDKSTELEYMCQVISNFASLTILEGKAKNTNNPLEPERSKINRLLNPSKEQITKQTLEKFWVTEFIKNYYPEENPDYYISHRIESRKIKKGYQI